MVYLYLLNFLNTTLSVRLHARLAPPNAEKEAYIHILWPTVFNVLDHQFYFLENT